MMLMNTVCALALGYVLDMAFGDPGGKLYPPNWIRAAVVRLERTLRDAYADYAEARTMAGVMLIVLILAAGLALSVGLLVLFYKLNVVLGILFEGLLCWYAVSVRSPRDQLSGIVRAAQKGNVNSGRRYLAKLSRVDTGALDMEQTIKYGVEAAAETITEKVVAPIFWILLFGGAGGALYRCVNIIACEVGHPTENYRYFGKVPARLNYILCVVPSRIAAVLMRLNAGFLHLDGSAGWAARKAQGGFRANNSIQTISMAAGMLGLQLGGKELLRGEEADKPLVGEPKHEPHGEDVFWMGHLLSGVSLYAMLLAMAVRVTIFLVTR